MTDRPGYPADAVLRTMSLRRRVVLFTAGLAATAGTVLLLQLWLTEPGPLPARTHAAFAALTLINMTWAGYAAWALTRMPLFARDRVIGGWLATVFSALTAVVALIVAAMRPSAPAFTVAAAALVCVALAILTLRRARARRSELLALEAAISQ
ncbi:hypothetical protein OHA21_04960 [Actinoplanes sp. NBC_00393]|uniref:hypothetical protein n=1 Tax=Actinoplanes sp. NBC_00393 TaxID=2975953 RepID=UPI002E205D6C